MSYNPRIEEHEVPSPGLHPAEGAEPPPRRKRSGSEKRRRGVINKFRSTPEERAEMNANAAAVGLTFGAYIRSLACAAPTTRVVRPRLPELLPFTQALGRLGIYASNAHQLLKLANRGEIVYDDELHEAAEKLRHAADDLRKIIREYSG
jgi:hypothetical protein